MFRRRMASWRVEGPRFLDSYRSVLSVLNSENVVNAAQNPTPTIHPHNNTCRGHFLITARRFPVRLKHQDSQQESQHQFMVDDGLETQFWNTRFALQTLPLNDHQANIKLWCDFETRVSINVNDEKRRQDSHSYIMVLSPNFKPRSEHVKLTSK